jgi:hypothetical protein
MSLLFQLKNISRFENTSDYLPILTAALIVDMIVLFFIVFEYIEIPSLTEWYKKYGVFAVLADVLSIVIGVIMARFVYSAFFKDYFLGLFLIITCIIQLTHDLLFAAFFNSVPRYSSAILDVFKDYANEVGPTILLADATMMVSTVLIASMIARWKTNSNIILLVVALYILPYVLYSIPPL